MMMVVRTEHPKAVLWASLSVPCSAEQSDERKAVCWVETTAQLWVVVLGQSWVENWAAKRGSRTEGLWVDYSVGKMVVCWDDMRVLRMVAYLVEHSGKSSVAQ